MARFSQNWDFDENLIRAKDREFDVMENDLRLKRTKGYLV